MSDLKPCPFCNKHPKRKPEYLTSGKVYITCENEACPANPTTFASEDWESVWGAWNTRTEPNVIPDEIEEEINTLITLWLDFDSHLSPTMRLEKIDPAIASLHAAMRNHEALTTETET